MMTDPNMVFSMDPRHGLVARSGWEQEEARTVLRDLGWEWAEEPHALIPPDDVPAGDAGIQAVAELHLHGHRTGYSVGPYGTMRLSLGRAEQVFTKLAAVETTRVTPGAPEIGHQRPWSRGCHYGENDTLLDTIPTQELFGPGI
ncbi:MULTISPECIES: hypothetical protein [unclassified Streptomyces]|uniref:hypothetical protein n=1 Tax=unclassified Streptomyces TaxID=2593676 RepID=UPI0037F4E0B4